MEADANLSMPSNLLIGTASWSDPEFVRDWYPRGLPAQERLRFYAGRFQMVELNSSFYGIPQKRQVQQWTQVTPPGFTFNVKLHKLLSRHSCEKKMLPPALQKIAETTGNDRVKLTPEIEVATAKAFLEAIQPFQVAGKLGALLLQLSPSFSPRQNRLAELEPLLDLLASCTVAMELRNRNWVEGNHLAQTTGFLRERRVTLVSVDAPQSENFNVMPALDAITNPSLAYLRLHGRNAHGYISGKSVPERFDYDYRDDELEDVYRRVNRLGSQTDHVYVIFNNNRSNFAPKNAIRFREIAGQQPIAAPRTGDLA